MKFLVLFSFFISLSLSTMTSVVFAQSDSPRLWGRFTKGDIGEFIYRVIQTKAHESLGKTLVIRLCTNRELTHALASAPGIASSYGQGLGILGLLKGYDSAIDDVYFATFSGCDVSESNLPTIEYWQVTDRSRLAVDEIVHANGFELIPFFAD